MSITIYHVVIGTKGKAECCTVRDTNTIFQQTLRPFNIIRAKFAMNRRNGRYNASINNSWFASFGTTGIWPTHIYTTSQTTTEQRADIKLHRRRRSREWKRSVRKCCMLSLSRYFPTNRKNLLDGTKTSFYTCKWKVVKARAESLRTPKLDWFLPYSVAVSLFYSSTNLWRYKNETHNVFTIILLNLDF